MVDEIFRVRMRVVVVVVIVVLNEAQATAVVNQGDLDYVRDTEGSHQGTTHIAVTKGLGEWSRGIMAEDFKQF